MATATLICASSVAAPRCGVQITSGRISNGWSAAGGSSTNTSSAAPATLPRSSASSSAASSMIPPRAQLTTRTPSFMRANAVALISPRVSLVSGVWTVMKSARSYNAGRSSSSTFILAAASGGTNGS